ncbi:MAG TPA: lysylphosphatidylglycerol synthase domain-containing protein [Burkholderiaceae bacterium]|nr:lysylphosphatidylglycerol synthase domain-containing protein [Burkholderiaceae bacterium]
MTARQGRPWRRLRSMWPTIARAVSLLVALTIAVLLTRQASNIDWQAVLGAAGDTPAMTLAFGGSLAGIGYLAYSTIDVLARRHLEQDQAPLKTLAIAATSYAFNMNLGAVLGGAAIRLRLYHHAGLKTPAVASIVLFGSLTNWLGYSLLALVFVVGDTPETLSRLYIDAMVTRMIGLLVFVLGLGYVLVSVVQGGRPFRLFGHTFKVPNLRMAMAQSAASLASWNAMILIVYLLLQRQVPYLQVMGLMMFSSFAAMMAHIPAGLGVIEAVFVAGLGNQLPAHQVLAAVLMFRAVYQWTPLSIALPAMLVHEAYRKWSRS